MIEGCQRFGVRTSKRLIFELKTSKLSLLNDRILRFSWKRHRFVTPLKCYCQTVKDNTSEYVEIIVGKKYSPASVCIREADHAVKTMMNSMLLTWARIMNRISNWHKEDMIGSMFDVMIVYLPTLYRTFTVFTFLLARCRHSHS